MADNPFLLPDGTVDIYAVASHSKRFNTPIEGEVITPADDAKVRSDNAAMIVEIGLAALATGGYVAVPVVWGGANVEKEVKDITPLQIEKKG